MTKLQNTNCEKTKKSQIVTKLKNSNSYCDQLISDSSDSSDSCDSRDSSDKKIT